MSSARTLAVLPLQDAFFFVSMLCLQFSHKATVIPLKNYCVFPFELPFHFLKLSTNAYQTATIHKWHQLQKFLQTRGSASLCELVDNCFPQFRHSISFGHAYLQMIFTAFSAGCNNLKHYLYHSYDFFPEEYQSHHGFSASKVCI